ncbi:MAG: hypothetical protein A3F69_00260 [Acidobacteria bacterium RIFCSPLOWO2_12_FULL_66_10]|nr:MAG: hypothetical protein A3F69_00260 [Acidobacteria bacterium RIFCSPLOWO2_12_FULL_66_10]
MSDAASRTALRTAGLVLLASAVILVNAGFAAVHAFIGGIAWGLGAAATLLQGMGVSPAAAVVDWMRRVGARAREDRSAAATLIASAWVAVMGGQGPVPPRQWLSRTVVGGTARLLCWPLAAAGALGDALISAQPTERWATAVGRLGSRLLQCRCAPGVLQGAVGDLAVARTHFGFFVMVASGSDAVLLNFEGICGGILALPLGDPDWLAEGMHRMRGYADYVNEKERQGELGPRSRMPFSRAMVQSTADVLETYPAEVVEVMRTRGFAEGARAYWSDRARVHRMLALYFIFTGYTLRDVSRFFTRGLFDASDAQRLTLCELAVMASALPDDQKDTALLDIQATAPSAIVEFEHYVGLVRPWDGTPADKAIRRSASGALLDTRTVVPSVLDRHAVHVAQSTNAEAYALRTFLWLYRDETRAREVGERETARKFGPAVAARIGAEPRYPLEPWEVDALTAGGPRPGAEVDAILLDALRSRGLGAIADRIEAARA